jgi:AAA family ATP:ADP antiporter
VENLAWLFTGTLVGMLLLHPLYTQLVSTLPRRKFIALAYRFFILNLVAFFLILRAVNAEQAIWVGRVFFIWTSVFNLFVVSVFWSMIADVFRPGQGKRLFGVVAVGGTIGAIFGSSITTALVDRLGAVNLLLVSAAILELAVQASRVLDRKEEVMHVAEATDATDAVVKNAEGSKSDEVIGGGVFDGIKHILRSPYLLGIGLLMLFYTITSTFLYFQQVEIVKQVFGEDREARTRVFGQMDLAVNIATLVCQLFLTGRLMRWFGVGFGLAFLPVVTMIGFGVLGISPGIATLIGFLIIRRAGNFAIQRPAREALFTVLSRTDKYKAKNFSDTFIYRVGDQTGAWANSFLVWVGLSAAAVSFSMMPVSAAWLLLTLWLGRRYAKMDRERVLRENPLAHPTGGIESATRQSTV